MQISVIGSGYVGLVAATCLAELGHNVICVDSDSAKIAALNAGETLIHEDCLQELLSRHRGTRLLFSTSVQEAARNSLVIFIAVGTPSADDGSVDLSCVEAVARSLAGAMNGYKVIVEKSTVPVYTSEWVQNALTSKGHAQAEFDVVSNPEFLREGTAVTDFLYPDRIVVGASSERATGIMREIYAPLTDGSYYSKKDAIPAPDRAQIPPPLIVTSAKSAELIKHASNAFLAMKISFINAVASICESVGANVHQVCQGIGTDSRIGPRFLNPGIGYGGSCFPKDLMAFRSVARECGYEFRLLDEVMRINEDQRQRFLRKVRTALWTLRGKRLGALGLAFKGGTDDIRESPAIMLVQSLLQEGCKIAAYDPAATARAREVLNSSTEFVNDPYEAARDADALLILTEWEEFATLDLDRLHKLLKYPIVIDGRNLYDPEVMAARGFTYYSVGRPAGIPAVPAGDAAPPASKFEKS